MNGDRLENPICFPHPKQHDSNIIFCCLLGLDFWITPQKSKIDTRNGHILKRSTFSKKPSPFGVSSRLFFLDVKPTTCYSKKHTSSPPATGLQCSPRLRSTLCSKAQKSPPKSFPGGGRNRWGNHPTGWQWFSMLAKYVRKRGKNSTGINAWMLSMSGFDLFSWWFFADSTMGNQLIKPPFGRLFFTCSRHFKQIKPGKGRNSESMDAWCKIWVEHGKGFEP